MTMGAGPGRRNLLLAGLTGALVTPALVTASLAQPAAGRPLRLLVAASPGSGGDIVARLVAEPMQATLGRPIVIDNRPGASGNLGAEVVARAAPDGETVLLTAGALAIAPSVNKHLSYSPLEDLTGVALLAMVPLLIVVRPESPLRTIGDLLALVRQKGDGVSYGSFGIASPPHLVGARIGQDAGRQMTHVPYRLSSTALPDILSGALDIAILDAVAMSPQVREGRLRALAITGARRSPAFPDLPTLSEGGVAFDTVGWHGAFAPARTPAELVARWNDAFIKAVALPRVREAIIAGGSLPLDQPLDAAGWNARFRADVAAWGAVARAAKIEVD